ncbi:MAG: bifunctional precorrin-2 dehydrogenase/sirohydrochlorin ferrochelatase, partial [Geobacteraceae bacterium]
PALARQIREALETQFGPEYAAVLDLHGRVREKLLTTKGDRVYNGQILSTLAGHDLPTLFRNRAFKEIDHLLLSLCGQGFTLADLGVSEKDSA